MLSNDKIVMELLSASARTRRASILMYIAKPLKMTAENVIINQKINYYKLFVRN